MVTVGGKSGALVRGTIIKYNGDGTVLVAVDRSSGTNSEQKFNVPMPLAFSGPNGEIIAGYPPQGSSVILSYAQGEWLITSYINSNNVFRNQNVYGTSSISKNLMSELTEGRILFQSKNAANRIILDYKDGIHIGLKHQELHADPKRSIISHNFKNDMEFTAAHRSVTGIVKRDLKENAARNISSSMLESHEYDDSLVTIGMDPSSSTATSTISNAVRNLPLVERREITYEFQNISSNLNYSNDEDEYSRYISKEAPAQPSEILRTDSRTNSFNLNLSYPNHLIEKTEGTAVDNYGNILDLNRSVLPIGKIDALSFNKNPNSADAFKQIRAQHRKAIAYHFELNARKQTDNDDVFATPDVNNNDDYARNRSRLFVDIDKEGQFKINIPASSETGNIPLLTRYENASTILAAQGDISNPNAFIKESSATDIYHENFAINPSIKLSSGDTNLDGYAAPIDRFDERPIQLGTAHHDISNVISEFKNTGRDKLINYFPADSYLNTIDYIEKVVSESIKTSGPEANAGGRSGTINMDGSLVINLGANTIDRQSLWVDTAGGVLASYGRDRFGKSYAGTFDGDVFIQVGGKGIGNVDSRFANENDAARSGTFDIRILRSDGQLHIVRIDDKGCSICTPGRLELSAQQDIVLRSNSNILLDGESVIFYPRNNMGRVVKRNGVHEI